LFDRDDQGDYWWELRPCDYYPEFEKEKIVWQRVAQTPKFVLIPPEYYCEATTHFITTNEENSFVRKYLLAVFNSDLFKFAFYKFYMGGGIEGEIKGEFIGRFPIPPLTPQNQPIANQIVALVDQILSAKKQNPEADTSKLEKEIDKLVYKLYNLNEEEIKIIEGNI
jgi:adenine-specific DNA-methyltransferase